MNRSQRHAKSTAQPKTGFFATLSNLLHGQGTSAPPRRLPLAVLTAFALLTSLAFASTASAAPAKVTVPVVSEVSYSSAKVTSTISHAGGFPTRYTFEYSKDPDGEGWTPGPGDEIKGVAREETVNPVIIGLEGGNEYFVRITAKVFLEPDIIAPAAPPYPSFTTLVADQPTIPGAVTASPVFSTSAKVSAEVIRPAKSDDVKCHFEYITDDQYKANELATEPLFQGATPIDCAQNPIKQADAGTEKDVDADLAGLTPSTTYHLRLIAENAAPGVVIKEGATFTTAAKVAAPTVTAVNDASEVKYNTATLTGKVLRPAGADPALNVNCHFEYVTDAAFQPLSEQQKLTLTGATGGTFTLSFAGETTTPIAFDASGAQVQAALESLSSIGAGNVSVTGTYTIDFTGSLADKDVEQIFADPSGLEEAGVASAETTTPTEGHAGGFENPTPVDCAQNPIKSEGETTVSAKVGTVATTKYHFRLVAENEGGSDTKDAAGTFTTLEADLPTVTIDPVEGGTFTTAHISGTLLVDDPGHDPLTDFIPAFFEFSTDNINWVSATNGGAGLKSCTHTGCDLEWDIIGLQPSTTYFFRIGATYGGGGSRDVAIANGEMGFSPEPNPSITTEPPQAPPTAENLAVTDVTATSAHFSGTVNPNAPAGPLSLAAKKAYETKWHFECTPECKNANGNEIGGTVQGEEGPQPVSGDAKRLEPGTDHEVRLVVSNEGGGETAVKPFPTQKSPPSVKQTPGAPDGTGGYVLQGVVNPHNETVTACEFKWGPNTPNYAFKADCSPLPSGLDERQKVRVEASGGQFRLSFGGQTTGDIPFDAPASVVQAELESLSSIGSSGVSEVTRTGGVNIGPFQVYDVTFSGPLGNKNLPPLQAENGTEPLTGDLGLGVSTFTDGGTNTPITVEAHLTGLNPDAVYHSLLVVTYGAGLEEDSNDQEFKAPLAPKEPCANEQRRTENNSVALPECRAYEMVSPSGKEGYGATFVTFDGGDRVAYGSGATNIAKSGQNAAGHLNQYVAARSASGWETISNLNGASGSIYDAPSNVDSNAFTTRGLAYSPDLLSSVWNLHQESDPDFAYGFPHFRSPDGTFALIGSMKDGEGHEASVTASADLSHVVNAGSPTEWGPGVYEYVGTGMDQPRRVDLDNSGTPISTCTVNNASAQNRSVSSDGSTIVNYVFGGCGGANPPAGELWARVNGTTSFNISASQCNRTAAPACNGPTEPGGCVESLNPSGQIVGSGCRSSTFAAATSDGSRVFFTTTQQLVDEDVDQTNDIYACDIPSGNPAPSTDKANPCAALIQVSGARTGAAVESVNATSEDGSTVLFIAKGVLVDNKDALGEKAVAGDHNLYVWRTDASHPDGQTIFVGRLDSDDLDRGNGEVAQATPDGRYLVFTTASRLLETDTDSYYDVYRYDADTGQLIRVSTNIVGVAGNGEGFDAVIAAPAEHNPTTTISDDGTKIVFVTTEALSPADGNAEPDVYLWTPARVSLISTGSSGFAPRAEVGLDRILNPKVSITHSGEDIYFESAQQLTPADPDSQADIYDARVGGGFSFASPPVCAGEKCQPDPTPAPPKKAPLSAQPGSGNPPQPKPCRKGKVRKKNGKCVKKPSKKHSGKKHHGKNHKRAGSNGGGGK